MKPLESDPPIVDPKDLSSIYPTPAEHPASTSYNTSKPDKIQHGKNYKKEFSFVIAGILLGLALITVGSSQGLNGVAYGLFGAALIFWSIIGAFGLVFNGLSDKLWYHIRQKVPEGQPADEGTFLLKAGTVLFVLTLVGLVPSYFVIKNSGLTSGFPVWYANFFLLPATLVGIGLIFWGHASRKIKNTKKSNLVEFLCLSPLLIGAVFVLLFYRSEMSSNLSSRSLSKHGPASLSFSPYVPAPGIYSVSHATQPFSKSSNGADIVYIKVVGFSDKNSNLYLYESRSNSQRIITDDDTNCYAAEQDFKSIPCNFAFTTKAGTTVFKDIVNPDTIPLISEYFFQKGQTYFHVVAENGSTTNTGQIQTFIDYLQPTSLQNLEKNYSF